MAHTYDKVIAVLSQPPDLRKDFEVNNLLPWFRKKGDLFRSLKTDILFDIIKHCQFVNRQRDEVVIRQGEQGDCMYILMRGQVTIYIQYAAKTEDTNEEPLIQKEESIRQQLGTFVCSLGQGATFGEVALLSDDCIRTASIISDESTDLIVVDRALYNRSVKAVLQKEFEDKSNFIANSPFFNNWAPKYKKQLAMALQKEVIPYEGILTKQGEPVMAIYFIVSGEIKVVVEPYQHKTQYPRLCAQYGPSSGHMIQDGDHEVDELIKTISGEKDTDSNEKGKPRRPNCARKKLVEVCLLGQNESIGDIEILLDLDTSMQTAICTQKTEVLVLEMKHYERLLVKRNPKSIEAMKASLEMRLLPRLSKHLEKHVPLLKCLYTKVQIYNQQRAVQNGTRYSEKQDKPRHGKTVAEYFEEFVPPRGPLIDLYGPGTVFYRIRQRAIAQRARQHPGRKRGFGAGTYSHLTGTRGNTIHGNKYEEDDYEQDERDLDLDYQTSDPVLSNLENRMRAWLIGDTSSKSKARVARLHRTQTETSETRPGAKVRVRTAREDSDEEDGLFHGNAWV